MTADAPPRPAVFLDRDGTLIDDRGYVRFATDVSLLPGVADALVRLEHAGFVRIVVTNQSGLGRGRITVAEFAATEAEMRAQLSACGASLDATYHCPHAPDAGCPCRKPGTAMHREAAATWNIDLSRSWCVGDRQRDVDPARVLGGHAVLIDRGPSPSADTPTATDLASAVDLILRYL